MNYGFDILAMVFSTCCNPYLSISDFDPGLDVTRRHGCFVDFLFALLVDQGVVQAPLHAQWLRARRIVLAHVAFQRQTGIGFLEQVSSTDTMRGRNRTRRIACRR